MLELIYLPRKDGKRIESRTNIQISEEPRIEPGTLWSEGRYILPTAPTMHMCKRPDIFICIYGIHSITWTYCSIAIVT